MPYRVKCRKCGHELYDKDNSLIATGDILKKYRGKCPECKEDFGPIGYVFVLNPGETLDYSKHEAVEIGLERMKQRLGVGKYEGEPNEKKPSETRKQRTNSTRRRRTTTVPEPIVRMGPTNKEDIYDILIKRKMREETKTIQK